MKEIKQNLTAVNKTKTSNRQVKYIVVHYTAGNGDTAKGNTIYFQKPRGASAHYFVDTTEIWQSVEDNATAWSVGATQYKHPTARNTNTLNIEMCSVKEKGVYYIPTKTQKNTQELVAYLLKKYNLGLSEVIRHYDVTGKMCPQPLVDEKKWEKFKEGIGLSLIDTTKINGKTVKRVLVNGENYIRLRDIAEGVTYDKATKGVTVNALHL